MKNKIHNLWRKKWLKFLLLFFIVTSVFGGIITYFSLNRSNKINVINQNNLYVVSIEGAVKNPGDYEFHQPKTIREIIFCANVNSNADINSLNLEEIISKNTSIIVPFKINSIKKIKWSEINNIEQLTSRGIKKATAQKLLEFKRQNSNPTWEQIHSIKGIGQITLNQLKEVIELS